MPSSGAVIHMLCSAEPRQPGHAPLAGVPDRRQMLDGFLNSIWPWGRREVAATADEAKPKDGDSR